MSIRTQHAAADRTPWDWRILLNGKEDELMFERGSLATGGLPFAELRARALINVAAKASDARPDFSRLIRTGLPGFLTTKSTAPSPAACNTCHRVPLIVCLDSNQCQDIISWRLPIPGS